MCSKHTIRESPKVFIDLDDLQKGLNVVKPSAVKEIIVEIPKVCIICMCRIEKELDMWLCVSRLFSFSLSWSVVHTQVFFYITSNRCYGLILVEKRISKRS